MQRAEKKQFVQCWCSCLTLSTRASKCTKERKGARLVSRLPRFSAALIARAENTHRRRPEVREAQARHENTGTGLKSTVQSCIDSDAAQVSSQIMCLAGLIDGEDEWKLLNRSKGSCLTLGEQSAGEEYLGTGVAQPIHP
jgi:hypothetical protein